MWLALDFPHPYTANLILFILKFCVFTLFSYGWQFVWLSAQFLLIPIFTVLLVFTAKAVFYLLKLLEAAFTTIVLILIDKLKGVRKQRRRPSCGV